jgi:uncharacterized protein
MIRPPAIIDTNVVVAGFPLTQAPSPVARILENMLCNGIDFVLSDALLAEYREVLARPVPRRLHGMAAADVEHMLMQFSRHAIMLAPAGGPPAPDPGDQMLWDLLAARADVVLVTQDKRLLGDARMRGRVVAPATFLKGI